MTHTDLTKINTPFGELDDATKGALLLAYHRDAVIEFKSQIDDRWSDAKNDPAWFNGCAYRVRPAAPVIGSVKFSGRGPIYHSLHPRIPDQARNPDQDCKLHVIFPTRDGAHVPGVYTSPEGLQIVVEVTE